MRLKIILLPPSFTLIRKETISILALSEYRRSHLKSDISSTTLQLLAKVVTISIFSIKKIFLIFRNILKN